MIRTVPAILGRIFRDLDIGARARMIKATEHNRRDIAVTGIIGLKFKLKDFNKWISNNHPKTSKILIIKTMEIATHIHIRK
jgi:hypothetical protein